MSKLNFIYFTHLPGVTVGVGVTVEPLIEDEKISTVPIVERDGVIDSVSE